MKMTNLRYCRDCGAKPGQVHMVHCCMELCSVCGHQRLQCETKKKCKGHDRAFARWLGQTPAELFAGVMDMSPERFMNMGGEAIFCIKPRLEDEPKFPVGTPEEIQDAYTKEQETGPVWPATQGFEVVHGAKVGRC